MSPTQICALGLSFVFVLYFHSFPFVFPIFPLGIGLITKLSVQVCGVLGLAHQNVQNDETEYNNNNNSSATRASYYYYYFSGGCRWATY